MTDGIRIDYDGSGVKAATAALEALQDACRRVSALLPGLKAMVEGARDDEEA